MKTTNGLRMDPYFGVKRVGKNMDLVTIWSGLHNRASAPDVIEDKNANSPERALIDGTDLHALQQLELAEAADWIGLCTSVGWTVYGAIALSWCKGAILSDVWDAWLASGVPLKPSPAFERPARLLNPALLPASRSVSKIHTTIMAQEPRSNTVYDLAFCACIASSSEPVVLDVAPSHYGDAPPQIAAFLKSRLLAKAKRTSEETALMNLLSAKVAGTVWDVWTKERT